MCVLVEVSDGGGDWGWDRDTGPSNPEGAVTGCMWGLREREGLRMTCRSLVWAPGYMGEGVTHEVRPH